MTQQPPSPSRRRVWLTFDDGPHPVHTDGILKVLDCHAIRATFFVIGTNIAKWGDVLRRTVDAGHRIGNHTLTHPRLTQRSDEECRREVTDTEALIAQYTAIDRIIRAPYGATNAAVLRTLDGLGYRAIDWNVDTLDWHPACRPTGWIDYGLRQVTMQRSCIVLAHDRFGTTADNLDAFIHELLRLDVEFGQPADL